MDLQMKFHVQIDNFLAWSD